MLIHNSYYCKFQRRFVKVTMTCVANQVMEMRPACILLMNLATHPTLTASAHLTVTLETCALNPHLQLHVPSIQTQ